MKRPRKAVLRSIWLRRYPGRPWRTWARVSLRVKAKRIPHSDLAAVGVVLSEEETMR